MPDAPEIPDAWPPPRDAVVVPMFPLRGVFLFPRQLLPLHIFEPRYRRMIEESLDGPGRLVVATALPAPGVADVGSAPVLEVAGMGEIARHDKLPDGRFHLILFGLGRVALEEMPSDRPYRLVRAAPLLEVEADDASEGRLRAPLLSALRARAGEEHEVPQDMPLAVAVDLLALRMSVPQPVMERIFRERDITLRAELALAAHAQYPAKG